MQFDTGCISTAFSNSTNVKSENDNDCLRWRVGLLLPVILVAVVLRSLARNSSLGGSPRSCMDAVGVVVTITVSSLASLSSSSILVGIRMVVHTLKQRLHQELMALAISSATNHHTFYWRLKWHPDDWNDTLWWLLLDDRNDGIINWHHHKHCYCRYSSSPAWTGRPGSVWLECAGKKNAMLPWQAYRRRIKTVYPVVGRNSAIAHWGWQGSLDLTTSGKM